MRTRMRRLKRMKLAPRRYEEGDPNVRCPYCDRITAGPAKGQRANGRGEIDGVHVNDMIADRARCPRCGRNGVEAHARRTWESGLTRRYGPGWRKRLREIQAMNEGEGA